MKPVKVLIVDDSAVMRKLLTEILSSSPRLEVVGAAADPYIARDKIKALSPDVITLDVEMPRMDGLTFLSNLMRLHPMPVVMVSSLTDEGAKVTLDALHLGAFDFVTKPKLDVAQHMVDYTDEIVTKVLAAAACPPRPALERARRASLSGLVRPESAISYKTTEQLCAIGASTGGTEAIRAVLEAFPPDAPGTVITQHFPIGFSGPFATRLDGICKVRVREAKDGEPILAGHAYVAPGNRHLVVVRSGARFLMRLSDDEPVCRHRPSVDVMFRSALAAAGANVTAALLTGMGEDGAGALLALRQAGARTAVQDKETSIVWGMPGAAAALGAAEEVLPLDKIAAWCRRAWA